MFIYCTYKRLLKLSLSKSTCTSTEREQQTLTLNSNMKFLNTTFSESRIGNC